MVAPFIAVFAHGARLLTGARAAVWLGVGIMAVAVVAYGSVIAVSLLASYGFDAAVRLRALRPVVDVSGKRWVDISAAPADAIAAQIDKCPSGALKYSRPT